MLRTLLLVSMIALTLTACAAQSRDPQQAVTPSTASVAEMDSSPVVGIACPGRNFPEFLQRFASEDAIQDAYTSEHVVVADYENPDDLEESAVVNKQVPKSQYKDFSLRYEDGAFHNVDAAGEVDPAPLDVMIEKRGDDYYVKYLYGMSEGNSWLFKPRRDCWVLAEDPEPPSL